VINIPKIVILGGGSAGWLTALFINKCYPNYNVSVVEDPNQPPIIAGESGSSTLTHMLHYLGIDIGDWVVNTNAMPKLGSEFYDWNGLGTKFTHGLINSSYDKNWVETDAGVNNTNLDFVAGFNKNFIQTALVENIPLENIFYSNGLIHSNHLPIVKKYTGKDQIISYEHIIRFMWHFDSRANANYLKNLGISRGINLIEGKYVDATQKNNGDIESLTLLDNRKVEGDFFFDCSGFSKLLLDKKFNIQYNDLTDIFPARSVIAWWNEQPEKINHTRVYAMKYGWSWNINLHHRAGNGYLYDPDLINADQAVSEIEEKFNIKINPVADISFTPSIIKKTWHKNVIAIGISGGFIEPLEANGLGQVLVALVNSHKFQIDLYNKKMLDLQYEYVDFLALHYRGHRRDTEFWRSHANDKNRITPSLKNILEEWKDGIALFDNVRYQGYSYESYLMVGNGLGLIDKDKLKKRLLTNDSKMLEKFYKSFYQVNNNVKSVLKSSLELTEWEKIVYGKN
jgi:tryptophan 7-halogenase